MKSLRLIIYLQEAKLIRTVAILLFLRFIRTDDINNNRLFHGSVIVQNHKALLLLLTSPYNHHIDFRIIPMLNRHTKFYKHLLNTAHNTDVGVRRRDLQTLIHKNPQLDPIQSQLNLVRILSPCFIKTRFNVSVSSHVRRSLILSRLRLKFCMHFSLLSCMLYDPPILSSLI
jgi:hypothetical protein